MKGTVVRSMSTGKGGFGSDAGGPGTGGDFLAAAASAKGELLYGIGEDKSLYSFHTASGKLDSSLKVRFFYLWKFFFLLF